MHQTPLTLLAALALAVLLTACRDEPPRAAPSATATGTETAAVLATESATRTPTASPTPEPPVLRGAIEGWFTDPRGMNGEVEARTLPARPPSPFTPRPRDSVEVTLYDVQTMTERSLGPGGYASFSPDGTRLAWVTGERPHDWTELRVLDLRTGEQRPLGRARTLRWVDDATIVVHEVGNEMALVDAATGAHRPAGGVNLNPVERPIEHAGYRLEREAPDEREYPFWRSTYRVTHIASGAAFEFDAYRAVLTPDGTVFLAAVSDPRTRRQPYDGVSGRMVSNIFAVDAATRQAVFVATAEPNAPNWPFAASAKYVIWTDRPCDPWASATRVYDRRTGAVSELHPPLGGGLLPWRGFTPSGLISLGAFGAKALLDPEMLEYRAVLPGDFSDVAWSSDYRYAAVAAQLGHGGPCG